ARSEGSGSPGLRAPAASRIPVLSSPSVTSLGTSALAGSPLRSGLFDLAEIEFHGRRAPEDLNRHLQAVLFVVHRLDDAVEVVERPIGHTHHLARLEQHLRPRLLGTLLDPAQDRVRLAI